MCNYFVLSMVKEFYKIPISNETLGFQNDIFVTVYDRKLKNIAMEILAIIFKE